MSSVLPLRLGALRKRQPSGLVLVERTAYADAWAFCASLSR